LTANGVKDASVDPSAIRRWMDETSGLANIGIATGDGLIVVDIDAKSGGLESLAALLEHFGELPLTKTVATGGGGKHFYYSYPAGLSIGNKTAILPGIDIRGSGGYVVAPPSVHASGQQYRWESPDDQPLAPAPDWLLQMLVTPPVHGSTSPAITATEATKPSRVLQVQPLPQDLTNALGVPEGQRHSRLCQLVGRHLARGEDPSVVEIHALSWAATCDPPMDKAEVQKTVSTLATKHAASVITVVDNDDDIDRIPLPQVPPWPALASAAYHGLAGELVERIAPETEADPVAILFSFLACFGNAVGRNAWYPVEGDRHFTNLFVCLVGDTARGRKGTSLGRTLSLWPDDDRWKQACIVNGLSSGEGLKWAVRDKVEVTEPLKEKGQIVGYQNVIKDPGVADKRLIVVESEFAQVLKVARREGNTLSPVIRQAYDTGTLRTLTRNDPVNATNAHISIIGHITRQELNDHLTETDCANGFANRFLWVSVRRSKMLPDGGRVIDLSQQQKRLRLALAQELGSMCRTPAASALWHRLYPILTADRAGLWGKITGRAEAHTLRLSMIYALLDCSRFIDIPHLEAAYAVWEYAQASAKLVFGEQEPIDPLEQLLLQRITASPGINRKGLYRVLGGHVQAEALVQALGRLAIQGKVRSETVATGGRPSECWWPAQVATVVPEAARIDCPTANERTKPPKPQPTPVADGTSVLLASPQPESDSSFARGEQTLSGGECAEATVSTLTLGELLNQVLVMGGTITRTPDGNFMVAGVDAATIPVEIAAAIKAHRGELDLLTQAETNVTPVDHHEALLAPAFAAAAAVPSTASAAEARVLTEEEFFAEMAEPPVPAQSDEDKRFDEEFDRLCEELDQEKMIALSQEQGGSNEQQ
jgi:hypothetical protein